MHLDREIWRVPELDDLGDSVADEVLEKFAGQRPHPVFLVAQKSLRVARIIQAVCNKALNMDWRAAQRALPHQLTQPDHFRAELVIVTRRDPETSLLGQGQHCPSLLEIDRKGFFY